MTEWNERSDLVAIERWTGHDSVYSLTLEIPQQSERSPMQKEEKEEAREQRKKRKAHT